MACLTDRGVPMMGAYKKKVDGWLGTTPFGVLAHRAAAVCRSGGVQEQESESATNRRLNRQHFGLQSHNHQAMYLNM